MRRVLLLEVHVLVSRLCASPNRCSEWIYALFSGNAFIDLLVLLLLLLFSSRCEQVIHSHLLIVVLWGCRVREQRSLRSRLYREIGL